MAGAASQAGDADSSWAPGLTSGLQGSVNVRRGALLLVPQWQCIRSFVFYIRFLNSQTQQFRYSIPDLQELAESFTQRTPNYMSSIDLISSGFFQMEIAPQSSKYTAFNICFGTYKFLRLPMGLNTAPSSFQLLMDKVLSGLTFQSALCYPDDVIVASDTLESHMSDLQELFDRFRMAGLKLNPYECKFGHTECIYLGHLVSKEGLSPPPPPPRQDWRYKELSNSVVCQTIT